MLSSLRQFIGGDGRKGERIAKRKILPSTPRHLIGVAAGDHQCRSTLSNVPCSRLIQPRMAIQQIAHVCEAESCRFNIQFNLRCAIQPRINKNMPRRSGQQNRREIFRADIPHAFCDLKRLYRLSPCFKTTVITEARVITVVKDLMPPWWQEVLMLKIYIQRIMHSDS